MDDLEEEEAIKITEKKNLENDIVDETLEIDEIINIKESRNHPLENVIGNLNQRTLRSQAQNQSNFFCFISTIEPKNVNEALDDESCLSHAEELINSLLTTIWELVLPFMLASKMQEAPKTSHLEAVKRIFRYIKGTTHLGLWYPKGTGIETVVYADSDHAGDYVDRKSTSGICTFVGCCLTSWFSKKQTALAISTTEAEYVSAGKACQQALWMKQALIDYDCLLEINEQVFPSYLFLILQQHRLSSSDKGACVFTDRWRLDELAYGIPSDGPYQTNPPSIEDIISSIRIDREGQVRRIRHEEEIDVHDY
ncbi:hypothetical protein Tco_0640465 [Tanacetum coccineum]